MRDSTASMIGSSSVAICEWKHGAQNKQYRKGRSHTLRRSIPSCDTLIQWSTSYADNQFSKYIRYRDEKCLRCGTTYNLTCSHYWRRGFSSVRYDPENCIALCGICHALWENTKNHEYKAFMVSLLGKRRYEELEKRARMFVKRSQAIQQCYDLLTRESQYRGVIT